jgi:hypothetical protein
MNPEKNPPPDLIVNPVVQAAIARRAYELWQQEGCGHGSHERHWREAEHQLLGTPPAADLQPAAEPAFVAPAPETEEREVPHFPPADVERPVMRRDPKPL